MRGSRSPSASRVGPRAGARRSGLAAHWLVLALSLAFTLAATVFVAISTRDRDRARFANAVQSATDRIVGRLDIYVSTLRGAAALFDTGEITADEFRRYVERLQLERWYPGIQGIGWSPRVESGLPGDVDERYSITYLEPHDERNLAAMGYDMYEEERRREAMRRARDRAEPALSGRVRLRQEIDGPRQPGFLLYLPVYSGGSIPASVAERRENLLGFTYAPFRAHDLFDGIFGTEAEPRVSFTVYDGERVDPDALLFASGAPADHRPGQRTQVQLFIAGRPWLVEFATQPTFEASSARRLVPVVLLAGLLASAWLFTTALAQTRARTAAEEASRSKSAFLATMSHELRTPLNAIGGYVDLMQLGVAGQVTEQHQHYLARIQRAQQHLLTLINDVLDFARIDAGRVEYRIGLVKVSEAVTDAVSMVQVQAEERQLWLSASGGPDASVRADAERLRQILLNLLSNAIKFTEPGGTIDVSWRSEGSVVNIAVADSGIGIAPERLASVFEPFLQLDDDLTRVRQGAGLGLAISRDLARGMGGDVTVSSQPGVGSTFVVRLPHG